METKLLVCLDLSVAYLSRNSRLWSVQVVVFFFLFFSTLSVHCFLLSNNTSSAIQGLAQAGCPLIACSILARPEMSAVLCLNTRISCKKKEGGGGRAQGGPRAHESVQTLTENDNCGLFVSLFIVTSHMCVYPNI